MERREVPYPGEWQLPTSGRSSGEAFPVVVAAAAAVVPGVFVPLVSWPWPAGGLGASRCAPASPVSLGWRGCGGLIGEDVPVAEKSRAPPPDCKLRLPGNGLGPGGGREEEKKPGAVVLPRWPLGGPAGKAQRRRLWRPGPRVGTQEEGAACRPLGEGRLDSSLPTSRAERATGGLPGRGPASSPRHPHLHFFRALRGVFWRMFLNE